MWQREIRCFDARWGMLLALCIADDGTLASEPQPQFRVPPGFEVEQVAAPPLVRYPLFADFDDRGRLFVAEGTGTNLPGEELANEEARPDHAPGRHATATASSTPAASSPTGSSFPRACSGTTGPSIRPRTRASGSWKTPTAQGVATRAPSWSTGFKFNGNGCDIHGPFLGPDGRLYWTDGRHGYKVQDARRGIRSKGWPRASGGAGPTAREIERLCGGGFDNPVEIAFTPEGEPIGTMDQGHRRLPAALRRGRGLPDGAPLPRGVPHDRARCWARSGNTRPCCPPPCAG